MAKENPVKFIRKKEVGDVVIYEGVLKIYWGLKKHITLQSNSYSRQKQNRESLYNYVSIEDDRFAETLDNAPQVCHSTSCSCLIKSNAYMVLVFI